MVALSICESIRRVNGIPDADGTVHHLPGMFMFGSFRFFLEINPASEVIDSYFGDKPYILNSMGGNFNVTPNYASRVHRDIRTHQTPCPMLNTLVMLDDFTYENGATWLMNRGHLLPEKPTDDAFMRDAVQVTAPAGSILLWDSNLWHRAGENTTGKPRRIVTPIYTRPWIKPGFDYPRALGYERGDDYPPKLRQILGYNSRVPVSLEEWYQPPEKRYYRADQG